PLTTLFRSQDAQGRPEGAVRDNAGPQGQASLQHHLRDLKQACQAKASLSPPGTITAHRDCARTRHLPARPHLEKWHLASRRAACPARRDRSSGWRITSHMKLKLQERSGGMKQKNDAKNEAGNKKGSRSGFLFLNLEREKSLELSTSTLARLRSTN